MATRTLDSALREVRSAMKPQAPAARDMQPERDPVGAIFEVLLRGRYRKGSLSAMDAEGFVARHRARVAARVARSDPVQLTLIAFPVKVPNPLKVGSRTAPDLAEVAALLTLERLHLDVQRVYAPGIEVVILSDGAYIADVFDVPRHETYEYASYFRRLLRATGTDAFVRCEDLLPLLGPIGHEDAPRPPAPRGIAGDEAAFRKTLGMLNVRWLRRGELAHVYRELQHGDTGCLSGDAATLYRQVRTSMARYAAYDDFLHRFDPRPVAFPDAIHATTRARPRRLALWLLRRGRSLLPWHGVGVLVGSGRIEVKHAAELECSPNYRRVFIDGETTPFFYEGVGDDVPAERVREP